MRASDRCRRADGRRLRQLLALTVCLLVPGAAESQTRLSAVAGGPAANYAVDGRALGSRVSSDGALRDYKCSPSEQFEGFTWCQKTSREREWRVVFETNYSILHARDGTVVYVNRSQPLALLNGAEAGRDIQRYTRLFGEAPKISKLPRRFGIPEAIIATWGRIELEPLDADSIKLLAEGKSPKKGFLLDHLGNLTRSAQDGFPIYGIRGGAGFAWAGSFDPIGRGTLRLVAVDASALQPEPAPSTQPVNLARGGDESRPGDSATPASRPEQGPATKAVDGVVAQLQSELSLAWQKRAEAEEAARLARTDAELARKEMEEAKDDANAAAAEITRLKEAVAEPSSYLEGHNPVLFGSAAFAILVLGAGLGWRASRWGARPRASGPVDTSTAVKALPPPPATPPIKHRIEPNGLVRELGSRRELEEVTAPSSVGVLQDKSLKSICPQEHAAPPIAVSSERVLSDADANSDPSPSSVVSIEEGTPRPELLEDGAQKGPRKECTGISNVDREVAPIVVL